MLVLVTGGAGFIGSHSVELLLQSGIHVRVLDNFSSGSKKNLPEHHLLEVYEGDIRNIKDVELAMGGVTHVLHLAAQVSVQSSIDSPTHSCANNVMGFVIVLDAARRAGVKNFIYASSAAVYGIPDAVPLSENSAVQPLSPYGMEKSINDQYANLYYSLYGFASLGLRYFNIYGPGQNPSSPYSGVISKFLGCIQDGKPLQIFGDGLQTRDFIYVKDIAKVNIAALNSRITGVCNVGTGKSVTLLDVISVLEDCLNTKLEVIHGAERVGDIRESITSVTRLKSELRISADCQLKDGLSALLNEISPQVVIDTCAA